MNANDMKRAYWDRMAARYEDEIFEVAKQDREGLVLGAIARHANPAGTASDLGCGIGDFLPALSTRFREVLAVDLSAKCIARARAQCSGLKNVSYRTLDLAKPGVRLPRVDVALSVNSLLTPSLAHRGRMLNAVCGSIRPGGHLVLVVPSLESALLADFRLVEWNLRDGISPRVAARTGFQTGKGADHPKLREGIVEVGGVATKHHLREELIALLTSRGMEILRIEKIQYAWNTEFAIPPRWMKDPYPWDWMCEARKTG